MEQMMNIQALVDALNNAAQLSRKDYHLTLGRLCQFLGGIKPDLPVCYSDGKSPGRAGSYRGYYCDLSFSDAKEPVTSGAFLAACREALGGTFEGYKGGDYVMSDGTPLWRSEYGESSGVAIVDAVADRSAVLLVTKQLD